MKDGFFDKETINVTHNIQDGRLIEKRTTLEFEGYKASIEIGENGCRTKDLFLVVHSDYDEDHFEIWVKKRNGKTFVALYGRGEDWKTRWRTIRDWRGLDMLSEALKTLKNWLK